MAIWEMVRDAVKTMGGKATIPQLEQYFKESHRSIKLVNIDPATREITVNSKSRVHFSSGKKIRRTNTNNKYDCLFENTDGYYEIYDPQKHGVWEIYKDEEKLSIRLIDEINLKDENEHENFLASNYTHPIQTNYSEQADKDKDNNGERLPPERRIYETNTIIRDQRLPLQVKEMYEYRCQICEVRLESGNYKYAEAAHIKALGKPHNGDDLLNNILCLCPNHHKLFDMGGFFIEDDLTIPVLKKKLYKHPDHTIDLDAIRYHRAWCIES